MKNKSTIGMITGAALAFGSATTTFALAVTDDGNGDVSKQCSSCRTTDKARNLASINTQNKIASTYVLGILLFVGSFAASSPSKKRSVKPNAP